MGTAEDGGVEDSVVSEEVEEATAGVIMAVVAEVDKTRYICGLFVYFLS